MRETARSGWIFNTTDLRRSPRQLVTWTLEFSFLHSSACHIICCYHYPNKNLRQKVQVSYTELRINDNGRLWIYVVSTLSGKPRSKLEIGETAQKENFSGATDDVSVIVSRIKTHVDLLSEHREAMFPLTSDVSHERGYYWLKDRSDSIFKTPSFRWLSSRLREISWKVVGECYYLWLRYSDNS